VVYQLKSYKTFSLFVYLAEHDLTKLAIVPVKMLTENADDIATGNILKQPKEIFDMNLTDKDMKNTVIKKVVFTTMVSPDKIKGIDTGSCGIIQMGTPQCSDACIRDNNPFNVDYMKILTPLKISEVGNKPIKGTRLTLEVIDNKTIYRPASAGPIPKDGEKDDGLSTMMLLGQDSVGKFVNFGQKLSLSLKLSV
jgi:hypothetical protein